jgi:hypothetical protein
MSQLDELRALLSPRAITRATVMKVVGQTATAATRGGGATLRIAPGLTLAKGDNVQVQDDLVIGKVASTEGLPVYRV